MMELIPYNDFNFDITFPTFRNDFSYSAAYGLFVFQLIRYARAYSSYDGFQVEFDY